MKNFFKGWFLGINKTKAMKKITILNTSILTNFGKYTYNELTLEESKRLIGGGFESAVGHESTCEILSSLLGEEIKMNRIQYSQQVGETALVFKLKGRPQEGKILTVQEIEAIGYEFGSLIRYA
jgi:hypothetical protein